MIFDFHVVILIQQAVTSDGEDAEEKELGKFLCGSNFQISCLLALLLLSSIFIALNICLGGVWNHVESWLVDG